MNQAKWNEEEITDYIDGNLSPQERHALESDMARSADLRRRVESTQQVVALMREAPLREAPRNYLLTPAMVKEKAPAPARKRRRPALFFMRMATSIMAMAFVLTVLLNLLTGSTVPTMTTEPPADVEVGTMLREPEMTEEALEMVADEMLDREEMELAPMDAAPREGLGGAVETLEAPMEAASLEESAEDVAMEEAAVAPPATEVPEETVTETVVPSVEMPPLSSDPPLAFPPRWLSVALGLATLVLAGITYWMSRQQ